MNVTEYGPAALPEGGVQLNVPLVCAALDVNVAPGGRPAAASDAIASRSGSLAVTVKLTADPTAASCVSGAVTAGGRSTFATEIEVVAEPLRVFAAVNVTV